MKRPPLLRSFSHAFTGMWRAVLLERNLRIHLVAMVAVCTLAAWLPVNARDWAILILTIAVVLAAELINTSLEAIVDLVSPDQHDLAKLAKDVAAAAVLILAFAAVLIGLTILGPPLLAKLR